MEHQTIFIGGIHGVGKTWFCNSLSQQLGIHYVSASTLIQEAKNAPHSPHKNVDQIIHNQDILVAALNTRFWRTYTIILDGHFCLLNKQSKIENVPLIIFEQINLKLVFVLTETPQIIQSRLQERDGIPYSSNFLSEFQSREVERAKYICTSLGCSIRVLSQNTDTERTMEYIRHVCGI